MRFFRGLAKEFSYGKIMNCIGDRKEQNDGQII